MPFDLAAFMASRPGHSGLIGLAAHDQGPDWAALALAWRAELDGGEGEIASGAVLAMMDVASACAIWCRLGALTRQVTLDLRLDRLRAPAPGATLVGRCECYRLADDIAFVRGAAHDGDPADPVANVVGSFMLLGPR